MLSPDLVILTAVAYVGLLFLLAYLSDARARRSDAGFLRSPFIYTLSISVYCTSWTFYGAVGTAARSGLEFMAIYMGPTLVFVGWWFVLRKLIRISHAQRITSVADLLSSRFGKSSHLAVLVTLIAVITITPYIALQLKAITTSIQAVSLAKSGGGLDDVQLALGVAFTGRAAQELARRGGILWKRQHVQHEPLDQRRAHQRHTLGRAMHIAVGHAQRVGAVSQHAWRVHAPPGWLRVEVQALHARDEFAACGGIRQSGHVMLLSDDAAARAALPPRAPTPAHRDAPGPCAHSSP